MTNIDVSPPADGPDLKVAERVLCLIAAHAAVHTTGVARLQPNALQAAREVVTSVAKRASARLGSHESGTGGSGAAEGAAGGGAGGGAPASAAPAADPGAVSIERRADGSMTVTVRIVAGSGRPVRDVARDVAERVGERMRAIAGLGADVKVDVGDIDV